ncbi:hypothetical protein KQI77_04530 [Clostridium sp. MSJ-8]|uniref:hypothetical protein n=1 Tax=Clostridium sp. MSJ-8 TaxID=2841510 RepID=UPI001C0EC090|nr:hypothetical protein [Clostridium sp. MSJ-8]MBU5487428.1 hypothetical protein [Clostridium sp. MSJ-8]
MIMKISVSCNNCSYEEKFLIGQIKNVSSIEEIYNELEEEDKIILDDLDEKNEILSFTYYNKLTYCARCRKLESSALVNIFTRSGKIITLNGRCKVCKSNLNILNSNEDIFKVKCNKCNKNTLSVVENILTVADI